MSVKAEPILILVTGGTFDKEYNELTDTMIETAKVIAKRVKNKTIVLIGAMVPYKFGSSDGLFNLGSALAFVQTLSPGVYVAMNGRYFRHDQVRKNREKGEFDDVAQ